MSEVLSVFDSGKQEVNLSQSADTSMSGDTSATPAEPSQLSQPGSERNQCESCGQQLRPGELVCSRCGKTAHQYDDAKRRTNQLEDRTPVGFECPTCQYLCKPGTMVCSNCGNVFASDDNTYNLDRREMLFPFTWDKTNAISVDTDEPIFFEIEGKSIRLPVADVVDVGRLPPTTGAANPLPYLSLATLGAAEKGVSRLHIKIIRKHELVYVRDVGSTNGTMHNGKFLVTNSPQVLRSGDELRLGTMVIRVRFQTPPRTSQDKVQHSTQPSQKSTGNI